MDPKLNRSTEYQMHQQEQQFRRIKSMVFNKTSASKPNIFGSKHYRMIREKNSNITKSKYFEKLN